VIYHEQTQRYLILTS